MSEIVTNSVRHAGLDEREEIVVSVTASPDGLHVEVHDAGWGFEPPQVVARPEAASGWGLFLLQRLASSWGARRAGDRTIVWFDLGSSRA